MSVRRRATTSDVRPRPQICAKVLGRQVKAVVPHHRVVLDPNREESCLHTELCNDLTLFAHHEIAKIHLTLDAIVEAYP